jgi:proteic killer suppression protein
MAWVELVESQGLEEARRIPGFHDEPLGGSRNRQRSIRLSRFYRAIYEIETDEAGELAGVKEVTKHEY